MWRFEVRTPDGRVWYFENEHQARGRADEYNRHVPRGGKLAAVVTRPKGARDA